MTDLGTLGGDSSLRLRDQRRGAGGRGIQSDCQRAGSMPITGPDGVGMTDLGSLGLVEYTAWFLHT